MTRLLAWPFLLSLAAGLGSLGLVAYLWEARQRPGARWLLVTLVGQSGFCLAYAGGLLVTDPGLRYALEVLAVVCLHWLGVPFFGFALEYTGRSSLVESWYYRATFLLPITATLLLPLNPVHGLFWTDFSVAGVAGVAGATYTIQPLLFVTVLGGSLGAAFGGIVLLDTFLSYGPLYRTEAIAVGLSPIPPAVGIVVWLFEIGPLTALNLTAPLFLPHVLLDAHAFARSGMFEFHPATTRAAERSALADLGSPVVVCDERGRIVDLNDAASALLGEDVVTRPIGSVLGEEISLAESQRLALQRAGERRTFRLRPAPLTDSADTHVGYTLVFQDITEEVRREQRLQVLNRVLRHNLRNDMSVVQGNVAVARDAVDDDAVTTRLDAATDRASELVATSEKARDIADLIGGDTEVVPVDARVLCETVAAEFRDRYPSATVTVTGEDAVRVHSSPRTLRTLLENLVENAIEHGGDAPTVTLRVERADAGTVRLAVSDDGPGIPEAELETIRAGQETELQHTSGLGLWVVTWGATLLGAEVDFDAGPGGTTVTIALPDRNDGSSTEG